MRSLALVALAACAAAAPVAFYSQRVDDGGIPILGHRTVTREGMQAARDRLDRVLHDAPRIRRNLIAGHYELHVAALLQFPSDLPEYRTKRNTLAPTGETFDGHMIGGHISEDGGHFSSCMEGTLLPIVGHRLFGDETCIHELAHAIEWFGLDGALRERVLEEYAASMEAGLWKGEYAATNSHEWFAEISKYYFRADREDLAFYDPRLAHGHAWLCHYDARACAFATELYSDRIDPGTPRIVHVQPGSGAATIHSGDGHLPTRLVVRNTGRERIHLVWVDFEGKRDTRMPFARQAAIAPGEETAAYSFSTHTYVVTDDAEAPLCTIVVPEDEAVVEIAGRCP